MTFRQRLGMLRKERGYTQKTFAQELSVTERCIRAYENETRHPDYFGLIALAVIVIVTLCTKRPDLSEEEVLDIVLADRLDLKN